ncbi:unnamed protein product [Zymoseptoria tritici ST99CH_3D1]|nr:unnamed protein product [Zymoseptoria tritici ST99CH_3D1]
MATHKPTSTDTTLLLHGLGSFILLLAMITLLDPANLFSATLPLGCFGVVILVLPLSGTFRRIMEGDFDKGSKKVEAHGGGRQTRREEARRKRKGL